MDRHNERERAVYLHAVLAIEDANAAGLVPPRWAVLVTREWCEMPEPVDAE